MGTVLYHEETVEGQELFWRVKICISESCGAIVKVVFLLRMKSSGRNSLKLEQKYGATKTLIFDVTAGI